MILLSLIDTDARPDPIAGFFTLLDRAGEPDRQHLAPPHPRQPSRDGVVL